MATTASPSAPHSPPIPAAPLDAIRPSTYSNEDFRSWYALRVQPNRERAIAGQLSERGFTTYVPMEPKLISYAVRTWFGISQRKRSAVAPIFPGYLFLRLHFVLDACRRHAFETISGIHGFLTVDNVARPFTEEEMEMIHNIEEELRLRADIRSRKHRFKPGQRVRIELGALANLIATVARIERADDAERITLLVNLLGRDTETTLPVDHVTAL